MRKTGAFIEELKKSEEFGREIGMNEEIAIHSLKGIYKRIAYGEVDEEIKKELCDEERAEFWENVDLAAIAFAIQKLET